MCLSICVCLLWSVCKSFSCKSHENKVALFLFSFFLQLKWLRGRFSPQNFCSTPFNFLDRRETFKNYVKHFSLNFLLVHRYLFVNCFKLSRKKQRRNALKLKFCIKSFPNYSCVCLSEFICQNEGFVRKLRHVASNYCSITPFYFNFRISYWRNLRTRPSSF